MGRVTYVIPSNFIDPTAFDAFEERGEHDAFVEATVLEERRGVAALHVGDDGFDVPDASGFGLGTDEFDGASVWRGERVRVNNVFLVEIMGIFKSGCRIGWV